MGVLCECFIVCVRLRDCVPVDAAELSQLVLNWPDFGMGNWGVAVSAGCILARHPSTAYLVVKVLEAAGSSLYRQDSKERQDGRERKDGHFFCGAAFPPFRELVPRAAR